MYFNRHFNECTHVLCSTGWCCPNSGRWFRWCTVLDQVEKADCPWNHCKEVACLWIQLVVHICEGNHHENSKWSSYLMRITTRSAHINNCRHTLFEFRPLEMCTWVSFHSRSCTIRLEFFLSRSRTFTFIENKLIIFHFSCLGWKSKRRKFIWITAKNYFVANLARSTELYFCISLLFKKSFQDELIRSFFNK